MTKIGQTRILPENQALSHCSCIMDHQFNQNTRRANSEKNLLTYVRTYVRKEMDLQDSQTFAQGSNKNNTNLCAGIIAMGDGGTDFISAFFLFLKLLTD